MVNRSGEILGCVLLVKEELRDFNFRDCSNDQNLPHTSNSRMHSHN